MWHQVLVLALLVAVEPALPAITLLVISRPRPVQNLLAFWLGSLTMNLPAFLLPLSALHLIPSFADFARTVAAPDPETSLNPVQVSSAVLALSLAALLAVRRGVRQRQAIGAGGDASVDPNMADGNWASQHGGPGNIFARAKFAMAARIERLRRAWEGGSLWVSVLMGMGYFALPPLTLLVGTIVVASGASVASQIAAIMVFIIVMLAVVELALLGYLASPQRTEAVLKPVHEWSAAHRQSILITLLLVIGIWQLVRGLGIV